MRNKTYPGDLRSLAPSESQKSTYSGCSDQEWQEEKGLLTFLEQPHVKGTWPPCRPCPGNAKATWEQGQGLRKSACSVVHGGQTARSMA